MHPTSRRLRSAKTLALFGTASFLTLAGTFSAQAQVAEVLITGSLIAGTSAVGVPITSISDESFAEIGAVTISDVMKTLPAVTVEVSGVATAGGGTIQRPQSVAIHGIATGSGSETLMMINGMRYPIQGFSAEYVDPSIIPALAVDRVDVLAEGASATYGSDAVAGVINVILKRGFDGAISQVQYGRSWDIGAAKWTLAQLYGKVWDSGQVTLSYEWQHTDEVRGRARDYWTLNFEPYGYDDQRRIQSSMPASVTRGASQTIPAFDALGFDRRTGARACSNCLSVPAGVGWDYGNASPGPTTTWTAIQANPGLLNLQETHDLADMLPASEHNSATITFDQILVDDIGGVFRNVNLFVDGTYSNRRDKFFYIPGASPGREVLQRELRPPTSNPYYPAGAPSGLRVSYNLGYEHPVRVSTRELANRFAIGLEADLPFDWQGRSYFSRSELTNFVHARNMVNNNNVNAAIGNTVGSGGPGKDAFSKPSNVPYLNLFCDAREFMCNSPITMDYISGFRDYDQFYNLNESGAVFNGPLFELPGGTVRAAIGGNYVSHDYHRRDTQNYDTFSTSHFEIAEEFGYQNVWAAFGELNIPLIGEGNSLPFVESFVVETALRYDHYDVYGGVWTPKVAATWGMGNGLSLRGTWGEAFRAPGFAEASEYAVQIQPVNAPAGGDNEFEIRCFSAPGATADVATPGSLVALLNPNCDPGVFAGGITVAGGAGGANPIRGGLDIGPEAAKNWSVGFNYTPTNFLAGLNLDFSWYNLKIDDIMSTKQGGANINDPRQVICTSPSPECNYIVRSNPNASIFNSSNATFLAVANQLLASPRSVVNVANLEGIQFIEDVAIVNLGYRKVSGFDFNGRYDFVLGNMGAWHVGVSGNYMLKDESLVLASDPVRDNFKGNTGGRLRWRGRVGWAGMDGFSVTGFVNFLPHTAPGNDIPPNCFWAPGFSAGGCYAGSPYHGPHDPQPPLYAPGLYTFDVNFQYNTGTRFTNEYLHNLNFQLNVLNVLNKAPPFNYEISSGRGEAAFQQETLSPLQRYITVAVTKSW